MEKAFRNSDTKKDKEFKKSTVSYLIWFLSFSISTLSASRNWLRCRERTHNRTISIGGNAWDVIAKVLLPPHKSDIPTTPTEHPTTTLFLDAAL